MRTYSYKAKLSSGTHERISEFLEQQRQLYNVALQERIDCYKKTGKSISNYDQYKSLTKIRWSPLIRVGTSRSVGNMGYQRSAVRLRPRRTVTHVYNALYIIAVLTGYVRHKCMIAKDYLLRIDGDPVG